MLIDPALSTITCGVLGLKYHGHFCNFRVNGESHCQHEKINEQSDIFRESINNFNY